MGKIPVGLLTVEAYFVQGVKTTADIADRRGLITINKALHERDGSFMDIVLSGSWHAITTQAKRRSFSC